MAPFYFDLLTTYIECLSKQSEFTIEDIDVFRKVISLFTIIEQVDQHEESKETDFLKPKASVSKEDKTFMFNGFVEVKQFKQLIAIQRSHGYEAKVDQLSINTVEKSRRQGMAQMNKNDAFISDRFWQLITNVLSKMGNRNFRSFMPHQKENHGYCDEIVMQLQHDLHNIQRVFHPNSDAFSSHDRLSLKLRGTDSYRLEKRDRDSVKKTLDFEDQLEQSAPLRGNGNSSLRKRRNARSNEE